jgi:hypothetical protein
MTAQRSKFVCPVCGSEEWGSSYNFDGPGDTPNDPARLREVDKGGRTTTYGGTWTRHCHGRIEGQCCRYTWSSRDDAKHGVPPPPAGTVVAQGRGRA